MKISSETIKKLISSSKDLESLSKKINRKILEIDLLMSEQDIVAGRVKTYKSPKDLIMSVR